MYMCVYVYLSAFLHLLKEMGGMGGLCVCVFVCVGVGVVGDGGFSLLGQAIKV